jgi:hypothetical protein
MDRRAAIHHGVQGVLGLALAATYTDARKVPALEERIASLERDNERLRQWLRSVSKRQQYFHGTPGAPPEEVAAAPAEPED